MDDPAGGAERDVIVRRPPRATVVLAAFGVVLVALAAVGAAVARPDGAADLPTAGGSVRPIGTEPPHRSSSPACGATVPPEPPGTTPGHASVDWVAKLALPPDRLPSVLGVAAVDDDAILVGRLATVSNGHVGASGPVAVQRVSPDGRVGWRSELGDGPTAIATALPALRVSSGQVRVAWVRSSGPPAPAVGESDPPVPGEVVLSTLDGASGVVVQSTRLTSIEGGGVVALGSTSVVVLHGAPESPAWIESFDLTGRKQWERRIDGGWVGEFDPGAVVVLDDGVLVAVHRSKGGWYDARPIRVLRLDDAGGVRWDVELSEPGGRLTLGPGPQSLLVGVGDQTDATTRARVDALSCDGRPRWTTTLPYGNGVAAISVGADGATVVADFEAIESTDTYLTGISDAGDGRASVLVGGDYAYSNTGVSISASAVPDGGGLLLAGVATGGGGVFGDGAERTAVIVRLTSPAESGHLEDLPRTLGDGSILAEAPK